MVSLAYSSPFQRYTCFEFSVNELSKWPSVIIDGPGWQGGEDVAMVGYLAGGETQRLDVRDAPSLDQSYAFLATSVIW